MLNSLFPSREERLQELNSQLWQAGLIGMLRGTLIGLVSGFYFNYRYNHGHNAKFFNTPYKIMYLVSWNVIGIMFTTDNAKIKMSRQVAVEDELKRSMYFQEELDNLERPRK